MAKDCFFVLESDIVMRIQILFLLKIVFSLSYLNFRVSRASPLGVCGPYTEKCKKRVSCNSGVLYIDVQRLDSTGNNRGLITAQKLNNNWYHIFWALVRTWCAVSNSKCHLKKKNLINPHLVHNPHVKRPYAARLDKCRLYLPRKLESCKIYH